MCDKDLTRAIPSCPGWSAADLRDHVLDTFRGEVPGFGDDVVETAAAVDRAVALLTGADQSARNVAQECAIHRWDASDAFDVEYGVDPDIACEGVTDFFLLAWPMWLDYFKRRAGRGEVLLMTRTDGSERWHVVLGERPAFADEASPLVEVEVRGSASNLVLWLWGRMDPPEVSGDRSVLERMRNPAGRFLSPGF